MMGDSGWIPVHLVRKKQGAVSAQSTRGLAPCRFNKPAPGNVPLTALGRDFARRDDRQHAPKGVSVHDFQPAVGQAAAQTVKSTVCRIVFVVTTANTVIEFLASELLKSQRNVLPQFVGGLLIPFRKLVNPARDSWFIHRKQNS